MKPPAEDVYDPTGVDVADPADLALEGDCCSSMTRELPHLGHSTVVLSTEDTVNNI